ncbi:hypothetical protein COLO4_15926 [Corchorus olitorius]|uniref:Uncharacterized protein n=1 Tax=Corchorus olitorius TaxID=93759 RepID=A0A1R3JKQ5_9ROSI|nr:hypothetical protein COLO4_15926 [Corchorus olitorius]
MAKHVEPVESFEKRSRHENQHRRKRDDFWARSHGSSS